MIQALRSLGTESNRANKAAPRPLNLNFSGKQTRELLGERDLSIAEASAVIARGIAKPVLRYDLHFTSFSSGQLSLIGALGRHISVCSNTLD